MLLVYLPDRQPAFFLSVFSFFFTHMSSTEEKPAKRPIYEESSQYRHWRFSAAQLREIREASNRAAVERVKQNVHEEMVRTYSCYARRR